MELAVSGNLQPLKAAFDRYVAFIDASPRTIEAYTRATRQLLEYLIDQGITAPQREDIMAYRDHLKATGHKPTTVQNYLTAARLFFTWTEREGIYPNVADHVKGPRLDKGHKKDELTPQQCKDILASIDTGDLQGLRDYAMIALMMTGGLRCVEVSRANKGDMRPSGGHTVLYVQGKGHEERTESVKVDPSVEAAIRAYFKARGACDDDAPLFASTSNNNRGKRITTRTVSGIVKNRMRAAGYDSERLTAHSLRHTAVTTALLAGATLEEAQQFARHESVTTTMVYAHHLDKAKNRCATLIAKAILGD